MDWKKILVGAGCGLASAVLVDLRGWNAESNAPWNWKAAIKHWTIGTLTGALVAAGVSVA